MICNEKRQFVAAHLHPILAARRHIMYPLERTKTVLRKDTESKKKCYKKYLELCHYFSLGVQSLELYHLQGRSIFYNV